MDDRLRQRLDLYRTLPDTPEGVIDVVERELALLETDHRIDEDTAGMLTAHLVAAIGRALRHDPDVEPPAPEIYAQVVAEAPAAVARAEVVAARVGDATGTVLPEVEQQYLAFHLASLAMTAPRPIDPERRTEPHAEEEAP